MRSLCPCSPGLSGLRRGRTILPSRRCRSFAIETKFTDEQVLSEDFLQTVKKAMEVGVPFVHLLNEVRPVSSP